MSPYLVKIVLTTLLVVLVAEASKRSTFVGALIASLPITSILAITWVYLETRDTARVAILSMSIFWLVIPSLLFFVLLAALLRMKWPFALSLALSIGATAAAYLLTLFILAKLKIKL